MQVYARHTIGNDDNIGGIKDSIEVLFSQGTTNGLSRSSDPDDSFVYPTLVVIRNLHKIDASGISQELATVIEFTISSFATSDEATTARMDEAVGRAKAAYEQIVSPPSVLVEAIGVAGDVPTKAAAWEPLLEKIKLCTEIVDKIAEV
jgi:hypothetical protein